MTEPIDYQQPTTMLPFANRSGSLIASGILMLLAGIMTGCGVLLAPLATMTPKQPGVQEVTTHQILAAVVTYAVLSTVLIWLGAGLLKRRRWSRPLTLIVATHWLILGVVSIVASVALLPLTRDMMANTPNAANVPGGLVTGILIGALAVSSLFMIGLPAVILFLLKSDDARLTVEHFDPQPRWTDRCPIKILGLSLTLWLAGVLFAMGVLYATFPIGGVLLRGVPAVVTVLAIAAALVLAGYWVYKLETRGWWLGLLTITIVTLAMLPSAFLVPPIETYRAFGTPEEQLHVIANHEQLLTLLFAGFLVLFAVTFAIYMFRIRPIMLAAQQTQPLSTTGPI